MDTLLSVFLSLHLVVSPGAYTTTQIELIAQANSQQISIIENDPIQLNLVVSQFYEEAEGITILDNPAG